MKYFEYFSKNEEKLHIFSLFYSKNLHGKIFFTIFAANFRNYTL